MSQEESNALHSPLQSDQISSVHRRPFEPMKKVKLADIAREAKVGPATAERVLNSRGNVRLDTAERVLVAARKLGYDRHLPERYRGIIRIKACSAFTRVAACTLALSPIRDTLIEGFSHFVISMTAPIASGWSDCRVGFSPTGKRRLCTAHAKSRRRKLSFAGPSSARAGLC
jgi:hypothetical protein